jgi:hypothetical protein
MSRNKYLIIFLLSFMIIISGFYYLNPLKIDSMEINPNLHISFANNNTIIFNSNDYFSDIEAEPENSSFIVLGASYIDVPPHAVVVTQVDRVIRDLFSNFNTKIPPNHQPASFKELVPWMEGARVAELMRYANVKVIPATNVYAKKIDDNWFGPDDKGNYVFKIDPSKVMPLYAKKSGRNARLIIDTHGMNVLVPTAIKNHAYLVIGCGDTPGKAKAEIYMAKHGINCYAPCDRYTSSIMPYKGPGIILGSAPIRPLKANKGAIIGGQPVIIPIKSKIIVQTTYKHYPYQYCDTPYRFFSSLQKKYGIKLNIVVVNANIGQTYKIVQKALNTNSNIIAVRIMNENDKKPVEIWLKENKKHKAILFHSAAYKPGYSLFFEFPYQVTGQDPSPLFIKNISKTLLERKLEKIRNLWL